MMNAMMAPMSPMFSPEARFCDSNDLAVHKVPKLPIMIDQMEANPMDVREFTGRPLHTVLDQDALNHKMMQLFTTQESAEKYARSLPAQKAKSGSKKQKPVGTSQASLTAGVSPDGGYLELYEHIDFGGCRWRLLEYNSHTVGNYSNLLACGFLWWGWNNANNKISSLDIRVSADWVTFFDGINVNFSTGTIWMPGDSWVPNLVPFGWNDRISSHFLWYFR